jgi:hypothetical protein
VHRKRYLIGGVLAMFAALTRSQAWVLALPFAYMVWFEHRGHTLTFRSLRGTLAHIFREQLSEPVRTLQRVFAILGGPLGTAL